MSDFSDLQDRVDELENNAQESADNLDQFQGDLQQTIDDIQSQQTTDEENIGQLSFPLSQETIDLIKEQFPSGFVTLVAGTVTLLDPRISVTSNIFLTVSTPGGTQGFISYVATAGQVVITSTSNTETSTISYLILN